MLRRASKLSLQCTHSRSAGRAGRPKGAERGNTTNYGLGLKQGRRGGGRSTDFPLIYRHGPRLSTQHTQHTAPPKPRMKCVKHSKDKSDNPRSVEAGNCFSLQCSPRIWKPIIDSLSFPGGRFNRNFRDVPNRCRNIALPVSRETYPLTRPSPLP